MNVDTVLDLEWLKSATFEDLTAALRLASQNPAKLAEVNATLASPEGKIIAQDMSHAARTGKPYVPLALRPPEEVDPDEAAQIAADTARADAEAAEAARIQEEERQARETAQAAASQTSAEETAELAKIGITLHKDSQGNLVKIVQDYQVKDDAGRPIGRPTHLEAKTWPELSLKQKTAHENAVRYAERTKQNQAKSRNILAESEQVTQQATQAKLEADAAVAEAAKDPAKLGEALRKVSGAERTSVTAAEKARANDVIVINDWLSDHEHNYLNCEANTKIIGDWLKDKSLKLSYDNLESAFQANETRLAKPQAEPVVEVPAAQVVNPPQVAPAPPVVAQPSIPAAVPVSADPAVPPAASASQPAAAPAITPAAPTNTPAARRPGVNGSLPPGTLTAARPVVEQKPQTTTRAELMKVIKSMSGPEYRQKLKTSAQFRAQHDAAGIAY